MRMIIAYGLPGYGPEASGDNFAVCDTWPDAADEIRRLLEESAEGENDSAEAEADGGGDFELAWHTRKHADEMWNLAENFHNRRMKAPLYENSPQLWDETISRMISENFPYDVNDSCRIYAWEDDEFGADTDSISPAEKWRETNSIDRRNII
jgi:hypothetical protein